MAPGRSPAGDALASALALGLALAAAFAALAGGAAGHGSTTQETREVGPFEVTYFGYDTTTPGETIRVAWSVKDAGSGERVNMSGASVSVTVLDENNRTATAYVKDLVQTTPGFVFADVITGPRGVLRLNLSLPGMHAVFEQLVCDVDAEGQLACGVVEPRRSPGPVGALLALVLAAAAGLAVVPGRRGRGGAR